MKRVCEPHFVNFRDASFRSFQRQPRIISPPVGILCLIQEVECRATVHPHHRGMSVNGRQRVTLRDLQLHRFRSAQAGP